MELRLAQGQGQARPCHRRRRRILVGGAVLIHTYVRVVGFVMEFWLDQAGVSRCWGRSVTGMCKFGYRMGGSSDACENYIWFVTSAEVLVIELAGATCVRYRYRNYVIYR